MKLITCSRTKFGTRKPDALANGQSITKQPITGPYATEALMQRTLVPLFVLALVSITNAGEWPAWRGPGGDGVSDEVGMPVDWDGKIQWKAALPGPGNSTPITWVNHVFVTQANAESTQRKLIAFDRATGRKLWEFSKEYKEEDPTHKTNPHCASSPVTDGQHIISWFGSAGLFCHDFDGKLIWSRDLGKVEHIWGYASSPVIHEDKVILSFGPGTKHVLYAFDKATGKTIWETDLGLSQPVNEQKRFKGSWSTPILYKVGDKTQIVLSLPDELVGFDMETGKRIWWCSGLSALSYTSPIIGEGVIVAMSGYGGAAIGIKSPGPNDTGDLTASHSLWRTPKNKQRVGSGVIVDGHVYIVDGPGAMKCINLRTGKQLWEERLGGTSWSSMIHADGKLWIADDRGTVFVLKPDTTKKVVLAENKLGEMIRGSLAFSDGQIYLRTYKALYCIGKRQHKPAE